MESREIWAKRVERQASDLTVKAFCAEVGGNPHTFAGWKWRLGREAAKTKTRSKPARRTRAKKPPVSFVELPSTPLMLEVVVDRWTVRVPSSFDDDALRRLLDVLEARS